MKYFFATLLPLVLLCACGNKKEQLTIYLSDISIDTGSTNAGLFLGISLAEKNKAVHKSQFTSFKGYVRLPNELLGSQIKDSFVVEVFLNNRKKYVKIDTDRNGLLDEEFAYIVSNESKVVAIPVITKQREKPKDTIYLKPFNSTLFQPKTEFDLATVGFLYYPKKKSTVIKRNNKYKLAIYRYGDETFTAENTLIEVSNVYGTNEKEVINKIGDKIYLDRESFLITKVDPGGNYITLEKQETFPRTTGYLQNDYAIELNGKDILSGNQFALSDYYKKFVLLDFWGPWCAPCLKASPQLSALADKYPSSLQLIGIASDKDSLTVAKYLRENNIKYPNVYESLEGTLSQKYAVRGYPTFILIDPDGKIVFRADGLDRLSELKEFIVTTLNK